MLTYDQMNEIAAYGGFPSRYPHWRFGMEYEQLSKSYEYGLSKIYEMVINNNPSFAYLLEGNSLIDQKLVMAHVLRARRLLQEQLLLPRDRPRSARAPSSIRCASVADVRPGSQVDRHDGEPRRAHRAPHRAPRHQQGRGVHRPLPLAREPHRSLGARSRASRRRASPRTRRTRRSPREVPRLAAEGLHGVVHQPRGVPRGAEEEAARRRSGPSARSPSGPSATCSGSCSSTRRSSAGSATCSRSSATRPTTSCRRCRRRS